jgi:hypothetical protein
VKYPGIGRLSAYADELAAAMRRRKVVRRPRVRARVGHGEPTVLADDSPRGERVLALARQLVDEQRRSSAGA